MITLEFKCTALGCENGKIDTNRHFKDSLPSWMQCATCNGTGKNIKNIAVITTRAVNYGDHGETQARSLIIPDNLTVRELLEGLFNPSDYSSNNLISVSFHEAEKFHAYSMPEEKRPFNA